ncbi:hypothetical protein J6590_031079 [Homalodisca vitripennis]|nr:hypothetical protein J6590_031079 [Homalodisca vitripennis]
MATDSVLFTPSLAVTVVGRQLRQWSGGACREIECEQARQGYSASQEVVVCWISILPAHLLKTPATDAPSGRLIAFPQNPSIECCKSAARYHLSPELLDSISIGRQHYTTHGLQASLKRLLAN